MAGGQGEQREENKTSEELFLEHFTAEPLRDEVIDEILEETMRDQIVMTTPASHLQEDWQQLRILEDSLTSAASSSDGNRVNEFEWQEVRENKEKRTRLLRSCF